MVTFKSVVDQAEESPTPPYPPFKENLAIIIYTSGSITMCTVRLLLILFRKLKKVLGGRIDYSGWGSPGSLNSAVCEDMSGARLVQGYTMTETTCSGTCHSLLIVALFTIYKGTVCPSPRHL